MTKGMSVGVPYKVPAATDEAFRQFIWDKHGTFRRGILMEELNKAILHYMASSNTHAPAHRSFIGKQSEIPESILELKDRIIKFLERIGRYEDPIMCRISLKHIREAIAAIKGTDPRTVTKYLKQLAEYRIIKANDYGGFDFIIEEQV